MSIRFASISNLVPSFSQESFLNSLSTLNKKIVGVVAVVFAILAALAIVCYYRANKSSAKVEDKDLSYLSYNPAKKVLDLIELRSHPDGSKEEGKFVNDKLVGQGRRVYQNNPRYPNGSIGEGEFEDGELHGIGKLTTPSGNYYEGEFEHGALTGQGKYVSHDETAQGTYKDGKLNGKGKVTYPSGLILEGNFANGHPHGKIRTIEINGQVIESEYDNGKCIG